MKSVLPWAVLVMASIGFGQQNGTGQFTDPMVLLQAVAKNYAGAVDTFRLETIQDQTSSSELRHDWNRVYRSAVKGPGNLYRIESKTDFGSYVQVSDGQNEWVYQVETNTYVKRPVPQDWPKFPKVLSMGLNELKQAWEQRTWLEEDALNYKRAVLLPEEDLVLEGRHYPCYVVRVSSEDGVNSGHGGSSWETTFWIDKKALVFRKKRTVLDGEKMVAKNLHLPYHGDDRAISGDRLQSADPAGDVPVHASGRRQRG